MNGPVYQCSSCKIIKPIDSFHKTTDRSRGHVSRCKECISNKMKTWREVNMDERRKAERRNKRKFNYKPFGITEEIYIQILQEQNGRCAICNETSTKRLYVDHDHVTGKFRQLLCSSCNTGLGFFKDNAQFLREAANYIEKHEEEDVRPSVCRDRGQSDLHSIRDNGQGKMQNHPWM